MAIHSFHACFGLTRKKSAGNNYTTPNHCCLKFADQDEVDNFVDNHSKSDKIEGEVIPSECSATHSSMSSTSDVV